MAVPIAVYLILSGGCGCALNDVSGPPIKCLRVSTEIEATHFLIGYSTRAGVMSGGSSRPFTGALANQDTFQILDRPTAWITD